MRALLGMVLFSMVGCDALWASYVGMGDFGGAGTDGGMTCAIEGGCADLAELPDAALPPADLFGYTTCTTNAQCGGNVPACDQNTGLCVANLPSDEAFPAVFETSTTINNKQYVLMAAGDYDGDGVTDVAVSGLFTGPMNSNNATGATHAEVDFYRGDGNGGLTADSTCIIPGGEKPVYLLAVPHSTLAAANELLAATFEGNVHRCTRKTDGSGGWTTTGVPVPAKLSGFKQLALASTEGQTFPDLIVRTSKNLFTDGMMSGQVDVYRNKNGRYQFNDTPTQASNSNVTWVMPYRLSGKNGDSLALTWYYDLSMHPGVEFQYVNPVNMGNSVVKQGAGPTTAGRSGPALAELGYPYTSLVPFKVLNQMLPSILFADTQMTNTVVVLTGTNAANFSFTPNEKATVGINGIMLPFAGDANGDGQDEIGLYSIAANNLTNPTRRLQLLSYSATNHAIATSPAIVDLSSTAENYRGMALGYLARSPDRRRASSRKDLIMLLESPSGSSRLVVRRANLNVQLPAP